MRSILQFNNKRALSNVIAYVLLISITLSLSVLVFGWLRFYVSESSVEECSDNVNIIIESYTCISGSTGSLTVTLKNKGLFTVDGYILRVHDRDDAEFGFYTFDETGKGVSEEGIKPGEEHSATYPFSEHLVKDGEALTTITLVEVQPFMEENGKVSCKSYASQRVVCTAS